MGFPCGSAGKESACKVGDLGSIPGLGRSPGEGKGYPLQYSGLENSMDCIVLGVAKSQSWEAFTLQFTAIIKYWLYFSCCTIYLWGGDLVAKKYPTPHDPTDCSLPGFSVHGIFWSRILEWVAICFSRGSSQPGDQTQVSCTADRFFTIWAMREAYISL